MSRCTRICAMNDPDKGCLLGLGDNCTVGPDKEYQRPAEVKSGSVREKLVELLEEVASNIMQFPTGEFIPALADHLIANNVTVQEWRPASDPPKEDGRYFVARYDSVTKTPFTDILWFERGQWWNRLHGGNFAVTHWMPLPPLPKGE